MQTFEHNNTWFDAELHRTVDEKSIDFGSVETVLLRRIRESETLGALSVLQLDEVPAGERFDDIEHNLFAQISQYHEYDEPVNECLQSDVELSEQQWDRLKGKLYERIRPLVRLPLWEQQLMAPCAEPTFGHWEAMETVLFDRINRSDEQLGEPWAQYESSEEPMTASVLETAEKRLDEQIDEVEKKTFWEQVIASEEIVPYVCWERVETALFSRLEQHERLPVGKQPFWYIIRHYTSMLRAAGITAAALLLVVVSLFSLRNSLQNSAALPTLVYQLEGRAVESHAADQITGECAMVSGGGATLINEHGSIELQNDTRVSLDKITENEARYRVDFNSSRDAGTNGKVTFLVHPQKKRKAFLVRTSDYTIEVTGTYFRVDADLDGRASTRVLEGSVRISGSPLGDTALHAGQYLQFDPSVNAYRIFSGGQVLRREEIDQLPDIEELLGYKAILVHTIEPGAEVHIDGRFYGTTPIMLRQSTGWHDLRIARQGYVSLDTSIFLGGSEQSYNFTFALDETPHTPVATTAKTVRTQSKSSKMKKEPVNPDKVARMMLSTRHTESARAYTAARRAERSASWRKAIALYKQVLDDPNVTPLRREDALFSIAKLQAEHSGDAETAKEAFLTYLALFPAGSFAGESWLRLAEIEFGTNPDNAIKYYLKYFEKFPRHPRIAELQHRVGVIYLQRKQYHKAIEMFEQALANLKTIEGNEQHMIAENLHRALLAEGKAQRAESVRLRYLASGTK
ncbi:MAG: FecR domain-containing protein [Chitinispirillaceae bacterium]|nr:FecR domain-containing protein [Chitinispirillaceae bacterium]